MSPASKIIICLLNKSSQSVIAALSTLAAEHRMIRGFTCWDIEEIKSDAGTELTSQEYEQFCADKRVAVSFAPSKHQEGNHFAERTWQSQRKLVQCMLVPTRLPDMYLYHALLHACNVFNILALKYLVTADGTVTTPF